MRIASKLLIAALSFSPLVIPHAYAAPNTNFSIGLGLAAVGGDLKMSDSSTSGSIGQTTTVGLVDVSYYQKVANDWAVSMGLTYDLNKTKAGEANVSGFGSVDFKGKNHYSIYMQPFYIINKDTGVFAKIGYHSIKGEETVDGVSYSKTFSGIGYGLGVKTFVNDNVYLQAEVQWVNYSGETVQGIKYKPKSTSGIFSVGYRF